jgi:hypothetical protein
VADEREDDVVDERAARLPHEVLLFGEIAVHEGTLFKSRTLMVRSVAQRRVSNHVARLVAASPFETHSLSRVLLRVRQG